MVMFFDISIQIMPNWGSPTWATWLIHLLIFLNRCINWLGKIRREKYSFSNKLSECKGRCQVY